ncbi:peptidase inhibitor family I36 protein [Streptomyces sp. NPDC093589]|uniref:peptidase inhibitor family I36 protein n=1 Tax=Streptomyces sp. NPDC093589 TaxID=3366043 RepID=UPI0038053362
MKRVLKSAVLGMSVAAMLGAVAAGPAQASGQEKAQASAKGRYDCGNNKLCTWDSKNYRQRQTWGETNPVSFHKCGKGSWKPRAHYAPRSVWNRTTHTWYGLDKKGKVRQTVRKKAMHGSLDPDIAAWKSITHWCWK